MRNILFLCTGNSARSILAEALLNRDGGHRYRGYSAGSHPKSAPHPAALALLEEMHLPTSDLRSKSWDEFAQAGAPEIDLVITVCDNAAGEICPVFPGKPIHAHWGIEDPADVEGEAQERAFRTAAIHLERRIALFLALPDSAFDDDEGEQKIRAIGRIDGASPAALAR